MSNKKNFHRHFHTSGSPLYWIIIAYILVLIAAMLLIVYVNTRLYFPFSLLPAGVFVSYGLLSIMTNNFFQVDVENPSKKEIGEIVLYWAVFVAVIACLTTVITKVYFGI